MKITKKADVEAIIKSYPKVNLYFQEYLEHSGCTYLVVWNEGEMIPSKTLARVSSRLLKLIPNEFHSRPFFNVQMYKLLFD